MKLLINVFAQLETFCWQFFSVQSTCQVFDQKTGFCCTYDVISMHKHIFLNLTWLSSKMAAPFNSKTNCVLNKFFIAWSTIRPVICWFNHLKDIKTLEMHSAFWRGNPLIKYFTPIAIIPFEVQDGITNKKEYLGEVEHPHSQFCRRLSVSYTPSPVEFPKMSACSRSFHGT